MRIAFSLPVYWPAIGGCECLTHQLVHVLDKKDGVRVMVVTQINDQADKVRAPLWYNTTCMAKEKGRSYREGGVDVHLLGLGRIGRRVLYPFVRYHHRFPEVSMRAITGAFRGQFTSFLGDADIVHCIHNGLSFYGVLSQLAAREKGIPFVFSPTLHLYHEGWHKEMMEAINQEREFRYLPKLHLRPRGYHDHFWMKLCREADALVTWTSFERDFFVDRGIPADRVFPLRLGPIISKETCSPDHLSNLGIGGSEPVVLFLGRNHELKGIEEVLRAASRVWMVHPETRFLFVGPLEGNSRRIFEKYSDPRVIVIDSVTEGEKAALIRRCDIFCVPSLHESFGIVFLEAWYHGKPIVAADIPPINELNPGGKGGLMIRPTPAEISTAIIRLLDDGELRREMGEWGRKRVNTLYRWDKAADRLLVVYRGLLRRSGGAGDG